jgi:hypothetical protein
VHLCATETYLTLFPPTSYAQLSSPRRGGVDLSLPRVTSHELPVTAPFFCFQSLTNCPICKSLVLITMQQYPGWWEQGREGKVLPEPIKRKRMPARSTAEGSQQSERQSFRRSRSACLEQLTVNCKLPTVRKCGRKPRDSRDRRLPSSRRLFSPFYLQPSTVNLLQSSGISIFNSRFSSFASEPTRGV